MRILPAVSTAASSSTPIAAAPTAHAASTIAASAVPTTVASSTFATAALSCAHESTTTLITAAALSGALEPTAALIAITQPLTTAASSATLPASAPLPSSAAFTTVATILPTRPAAWSTARGDDCQRPALLDVVHRCEFMFLQLRVCSVLLVSAVAATATAALVTASSRVPTTVAAPQYPASSTAVTISTA